MSKRADPGSELRRAYEVLGLQPGVSPLRARHRYRQLVKEWHPDRHAKDPTSQTAATRRTQELTEAFRRVKEAAVHGEVPLRRPRAWQPAPTEGPVVAIVDTAADRFFRFIGGALLGLVLDFMILADSATVWIAVPVAVGAVAAIFGWSILEWVLRKLWWLA